MIMVKANWAIGKISRKYIFFTFSFLLIEANPYNWRGLVGSPDQSSLTLPNSVKPRKFLIQGETFI